jgi:uncharacterized surface protein with fasciclin (FAS1) repeats
MATTVWDYIVAETALDTLQRAVNAADLVDTLMGPGPYTIFAPQDGAFASLPSGLLDKLLGDPDLLAQVLKYHVVSGSMSMEQLSDKKMLTSAQGEPLRIDTNAMGGVTINMANVLQANILVDNGTVHVIDRVLLPPSMIQRMAA